MTDYWAWRYVEDPKLMDEIEDEGFDAEAILEQWAEEAGESSQPAEETNDPDDWEPV